MYNCSDLYASINSQQDSFLQVQLNDIATIDTVPKKKLDIQNI